MKTYCRVYFSLCLFLAISGRSRTQRKLNPREKFPISVYEGLWGVGGGRDDLGPPSGNHRRSCEERNLWVEYY